MLRLRHLPKQKGGRLADVATFCRACDTMSRGDAVWDMNRTLQSGDEAADAASVHVGLAELEATPVVVKLMADGRLARQEVRVQRMFRDRPHPNVVQGLCEFSCPDSPIRWQRRLEAPKPLCVPDDGRTIPVAVVVQEFIPRGSVTALGATWPLDVWLSIAQQLCFAVMEWYDRYGFVYGDWHDGNVLVDDTDDARLAYRAFGVRWVVDQAAGVRPVLTDFGRSDVRPSDDLAPWMLGAQLGTVWDMLRHACPDAELRETTKRMSMDVDGVETVADVVAHVRAWLRACRAAAA